MLQNKKSGWKWLLFVAKRFSRVDRKGRSAVTTFLASLGICFGVMTLIVVISVMNGFQMSFIDSIMEISSYHIQVSDFKDFDSEEKNLIEFCKNDDEFISYSPFLEAQSLVLGRSEKQSAALIRAIPPQIMDFDSGFKKEIKIWIGSFDISNPNSIVLGSDLARVLGVKVGSSVTLYALSGGNDVDLFSLDRVFTVSGIFRTGYADINSTYAFISFDDGKKYFGSSSPITYGLKIKNHDSDSNAISKIKNAFPTLKIESWKDFNRSFFGALKVEKNMLMILVFLIFVVVAVNIFAGMRRMVYEKREEIGIMSAFGGKKSKIQSIFVMQGFLIGVSGAIPGLILGLLLCVKMQTVFSILSKLSYYFQLFITMLFNPQNGDLVRENPMFMIYASIPPRVYFGEILAITIFGIFSSLLASYVASRGILKMTFSEVMRDE